MYWKHFSAAIEGPTILIQVIFICQQVMLEAVRLSGQVTDNKSAWVGFIGVTWAKI